MPADEAALDRFRDEILAAMRASEARLEARIDVSAGDTRRDLAAEIAASAADTRRDLAAQIAEARRHMDVVAERLRSDIALVAEGVVTLTERLGTEMREGFETLDRRVMRLESRRLSDERD